VSRHVQTSRLTTSTANRTTYLSSKKSETGDPK
jgi:hypothetical protein